MNESFNFRKFIFDGFYSDNLDLTRYEGLTKQPKYFELVLGHKDINLSSQKYIKSLNRIKTLKSGDKLQTDKVQFSSNVGIGLANRSGGNVLLFSRDFINKKYNHFINDGYELTDGSVE